MFASVCGATVQAVVPLDELFMRADQVLLVQVVEGRVLGVGDNTCGARYSGRIEHSFKGQPAGQRVQFGYYFTLKVGASYLVFLKRDAESADEYLSRNSRDISAMGEFFKRCKSQFPPFTIMHFGNGALEVVESWDKGASSRLIILNKGVASPLSLRVQTNDQGRFVAFPDFVRYVKRNGYISGKSDR